MLFNFFLFYLVFFRYYYSKRSYYFFGCRVASPFLSNTTFYFMTLFYLQNLVSYNARNMFFLSFSKETHQNTAGFSSYGKSTKIRI